MAYSIQQKDNVSAPDADYPYGQITDKGSGPGTPVNIKTYGDFHQFFAKLMDEAGVVANGLPDNDYSGFQLFESLFEFIALTAGKRRDSNDLDDEIRAGLFNVINTDANSPTGLSALGGQLIVTGIKSGTITQRVIDKLNGAEWVRTNTGAWGGWSLTRLATTTFPIGTWDMDSTGGVAVAHGLANPQQVRKISVVIRNNSGSILSINPYDTGGNNLQAGVSGSIGVTYINLDRTAAGTFDSASYNGAGNRGWVTLEYDPTA